MFKSVLFTD